MWEQKLPIIAAVVRAIVTGLVYWFMYGDGMVRIDRYLSDRRNAKLRAKSEAAYWAAPIRTIRDPRDAAGTLMYRVALAHGTSTPEQVAAIQAELHAVAPPGSDLAARIAYIRHAAHQVADADTALGHLAPVLREKLTVSERTDLGRMLGAVAAIHQGPTPVQDSLLSRTIRSLTRTDRCRRPRPESHRNDRTSR